MLFRSNMLLSLKKSWIVTLIAGVRLSVTIVLNFAFMKFLGVSGIALATSIGYAVSCFLMYATLVALLRTGRLREPYSDSAHADEVGSQLLAARKSGLFGESQ